VSLLDAPPTYEYLVNLRNRLRHANAEAVKAERARAEERARLDRRYGDRLTMLAAKRDDLEYQARVSTLVGWQNEAIRLGLQLQAELAFMDSMARYLPTEDTDANRADDTDSTNPDAPAGPVAGPDV
jgi:hypothetical protein